MNRLFFCCCTLALALTAVAQPLTRPEQTAYVETSRYADVVAFVTTLADTSDVLYHTSYGYTTEGRAMPLVVAGRVENPSPEAVRASGKLRVLVQGNIHAGEVEGKEAILELLRALAGGRHDAWLDRLVILFTPIYNADGNERVGLYNRPYQHGPVGGMGQRPNAQGLDLNRDHMKLASPEAHAFARLLTDYDPHVTLDLHTTNGSFHGYHLTYAPPLHPSTAPALDAYLRGALLPSVTEALRSQGWETYHYGNFDGFEQRPKNDPPGWYTFDSRPRFNNSYVGLRNRLGILSEAYAYLPFEARIAVTRAFVEAVLGYAARHADEIEALVASIDAQPLAGSAFAVQSTLAPPDTTEILVGEIVETTNPHTGATMYERADVAVPTRMLVYTAFAPEETVRVPAAYLVPVEEGDVLARLRAHGVALGETVQGPRTVEAFRIDSVAVSPRSFQGVNEQVVFGAYERQALPGEGVFVRVPVEGALARLVVALLEPRSNDGFVNWGRFGDRLVARGHYPIYRETTEGN